MMTPVNGCPEDAAALLPGYAVNMRLGFKKHSHGLLFMLFLSGPCPLFTIQFRIQTQSRNAFYLSYRFAGTADQGPLPVDFAIIHRLQKSSRLGLRSHEWRYRSHNALFDREKGTSFRLGIRMGSKMFWGRQRVRQGFETGCHVRPERYQLDIHAVALSDAFIAQGFARTWILGGFHSGAWSRSYPS
jgi:hypothetical protein